MIKVNNLQNQQVIRYIVDLIEPFICKVVQRKKHTFFVYRCSDYFDFNHLLKIHLFKLENNYYKELINDYWSAIDLIYLKIKGIPPYSASKKYFDILTSFILKEKEVIDFELFEIKLTRQTKKSNLSIKTHKLMKLLEKKDKKLNFVRVVLKGDFGINYDFVDYKKEDYYVQTHYGRKNRYIGPRFEN